MSAETIGSAAVPDENRLPEGFEPLACRLQEVCSITTGPLAASFARDIALMALVALGFSGGPVHDPVHAERQASSSYRNRA